MNPEQSSPVVHLATEEFLSALAHTAATTGFSQRLIEKDYYCTLVLHELAAGFEAGLVFKGGTSLSKVHAGFYRMSEDLDFVISTAPEARQANRREQMRPIKRLFASISVRQPALRMAGLLQAHNQSKHYRGQLSYLSAVTGNEESIIVEVDQREPILTETDSRVARTLLLDHGVGEPTLEAPKVTVLSLRETYAEKLRAALSRREPQIRDIYDIWHALKIGVIDLASADLRTLVVRKLAVPGNDPLDVSPSKLETLSRQVETRLRAVLRPADHDGFDLRGAYQAVADFAEDLMRQ